jgi:hypothetical protein
MTMAKKEKAIYEPGELGRVREKLGDIDESEAKRMAHILGGEVGTEKEVVKASAKKNGVRRETADLDIPGRKNRKPGRFVETADEADRAGFAAADPSDDPSVQLHTSYFERVKMDRYASQFEFEIKNSLQVFMSMFSFFGEPSDYVNPRFVSRRMNVYYRKIQQLVTATRNLLPRSNARRSERLKKSSPFVYSILDVIRYWNIERIDTDLANIQGRPRSVKVSDFAEILRAVYKPLFFLEKLDQDVHIKGAYKLLYKLISIENPMEPKEKNQEYIRIALASFADVRREVSFGLYPLLMKHISDRWLPFERIFLERRRRLMAFLDVVENEQIQPVELSPEQVENGNLEAVKEEIQKEQEAAAAEESGENSPDDPKTAELRARAAAADAERKAMEHGLAVLESIFPKAGWDKLSEFPDLYPYFAGLYGMRRGYELLAPTDPLQQASVLMFIMEDLCVALRNVKFGSVTGSDGSMVNAQEMIGNIVTGWRLYLDNSFGKEYLPRLNEYCRMLEHSSDSRSSTYAKRTVNELRWLRRLYFLPYFKFESVGPPPFQKPDITSIYVEARTLRKGLTLVAAGLEQGTKAGGEAAKALCQGIDNPWERYNFEVSNPVSRRLDALIPAPKRNNAALVFFALSAATVLDYLLNSESSWAYNEQPIYLFRSVNNEGNIPMFGIEDKLDADQIFKDVMKQKTGK